MTNNNPVCNLFIYKIKEMADAQGLNWRLAGFVCPTEGCSHQLGKHQQGKPRPTF
jgi:hypothetical protein